MSSRSTALVCSLVLLLPAAAIHAETVVRARATCVDERALSSRIRKLLAADKGFGAQLTVVVDAHPRERGAAQLSLTAVAPDGRVLLERRFQLGPADCGSAVDLALVVLTRFLARFPAEEMAARARAAAARPARQRTLEVSLHLVASGQLVPLGGDVELGGLLELGLGNHRLGTGLAAWGGLPRALGAGHHQETAALFRLRWSYAGWAWQPALEARLGPLVVTGYGYEVDHRAVVPWLELSASLVRRWRRLSAGLQVAVAPMRHRAVATDPSVSEGLTVVRIGLLLSFPIWQRRL